MLPVPLMAPLIVSVLFTIDVLAPVAVPAPLTMMLFWKVKRGRAAGEMTPPLSVSGDVGGDGAAAEDERAIAAQGTGVAEDQRNGGRAGADGVGVGDRPWDVDGAGPRKGQGARARDGRAGGDGEGTWPAEG